MPATAVITEEHLSICATIVQNPITLALPVPNSSHVLPFAEVAGPENSKDPSKRTPGCYMISQSGDTNPRNVYIGQSVHLGNRVKDHASGKDPRTANFVNEMGGQGMVQLFLVTPTILASMPTGLTTTQFLCVLEQYMFFSYRPLINAALVAKAGVSWSQEAIKAHRALLGIPIYVYRKVADGMNGPVLELVYIFESMGLVGPAFGFNRLWMKSILLRGGWFRDTLFFSKVELEDTLNNLMDLKELTVLVDDLKSIPNRTTGMKVLVFNTELGLGQEYGSKKHAARELNADESVFNNNRNGLFRDKYLITIKSKTR